jgi:hypothetical protein
MGEGARAWLTIGVVVAVLGVFAVVTRRDSYPVSDLPMFSRRREAVGQVTTAVAVDDARPDAQVWRLDPPRIAGTDEVIIAAVTVHNAVNDGQADVLCAEIAERVARRGPFDATGVEVVTERFDAVAWYSGDRTPLARTVHARCEVQR